jgi:hypothetical protein
MSFISRIHILGPLLLGVLSARAEPRIDGQEKLDMIFYLHGNGMMKSMSDYIAKGAKGTLEKKFGPLTIKQIADNHYSAIGVVYQYLINMELCFKRVGDLTSCINNLTEISGEMFYFVQSYRDLDEKGLNISSCEAKTRLIQMELRYPPYDWMKIKGYEQPKAYDAKAFLECVRK